MTHLLESRVIQCPYNLARAYLDELIAPRAASGEASTMTLTGHALPFEVSQNVTVTFEAATDPKHFEHPWRIRWTPPSAAYPDFDGELWVRADETYAIARLEITGDYRPPGGMAGALFDRVAGKRIASATAQTLLEKLGSDMEARYRREEDEKRREREHIS